MTDPRNSALFAQFDRDLNPGIDPATTAAGTRKKLWWRCPEGPDHVWPATGNARTSGKRGCRACAGYQVSVTNSLAQPQYAHIAAQLDPDLNDGLSPDQVVATTHSKLWWRCPKGPDHVWPISASKRVLEGSGCPACSGHQVSVTNALAQPQYAHIAAQLDPDLNDGLTPDQVVAGSKHELVVAVPGGRRPRLAGEREEPDGAKTRMPRLLREAGLSHELAGPAAVR